MPTIYYLYVSASLLIASSDILRDEFGVYNDTMPVPPAAQQMTKRNFYQRHKSPGQLPPLSQRNSAGPIRAENSQFRHAPLPRGSTLSRRSFSSAPRASSRFSRSQ